jgi:Tfp pilus assembly protein PilX
MKRQRGIAMIVALIVLVVLAVAGLAMVRQVGSGLSIAGNVAFKQNATSVADAGTEAAIAWLAAQSATVLNADASASGYFATWTDIDPQNYDWDAKSRTVTANDGTGNTVRVVIQRLCKNAGPTNDAGQECVGITRSDGMSKGGDVGDSEAAPVQPHYRITTLVDGPRNTRSITQVVVR